MNMILSIVIPVFNVERYIKKCLLSCLNQDVPDSLYEIIVVNDGSPDNSIRIAEEVALKYPNVRIISQQNMGLSVARNYGLACSQGKYIWFVDSDDYIIQNSLKRIISLLSNNIDILQLQYKEVYDDGGETIIPFTVIDDITSGIEVIRQCNIPQPAQFCIYKREFLQYNNLGFYPGIYHEDVEFKLRVMYFAESVMSDTDVSYCYLQRKNGSITSIFRLKNGLDLIVVMNNLLTFIKENKISRSLSPYFYQQISQSMNTVLYGMSSLKENEKSIIISQLSANSHLFSCMLKSRKLKYILEGLLLMTNIRFTLKLYSLIK